MLATKHCISLLRVMSVSAASVRHDSSVRRFIFCPWIMVNNVLYHPHPIPHTVTPYPYPVHTHHPIPVCTHHPSHITLHHIPVCTHHPSHTTLHTPPFTHYPSHTTLHHIPVCTHHPSHITLAHTTLHHIPVCTHHPSPHTRVHTPPLGQEGYLQYHTISVHGQTVLDLTHTEVPSSHRGQGLGGVLTKAALDHAVTSGVKVRPTCTYVQHYASKHPEYCAIVVD